MNTAVFTIVNATLLRALPFDEPEKIAIAGVMIAVSVVACLMPARRATQLDPVSMLR